MCPILEFLSAGILRVDIGINEEVISSEFKDILPPNKCVFSLWEAIIFSHKLVLRAIETKEKNDLKDDFFLPKLEIFQKRCFSWTKGVSSYMEFFYQKELRQRHVEGVKVVQEFILGVYGAVATIAFSKKYLHLDQEARIEHFGLLVYGQEHGFSEKCFSRLGHIGALIVTQIAQTM